MMKLEIRRASSSSSPGAVRHPLSLRAISFLLIGSVLFLAAGVSQRFVPPYFNGIIAQLQIVISILLIFASHRYGWLVALAHNTLQALATTSVVLFGGRFDAIPGIMMPLLTILIIAIIASDRNSLWLKHGELLSKQRELEAANEATARAMRAKSEFLSSASHELRTPMNNIMGYLELMSHGILPAEQREYLETVTMNARNLVDLLNDILDLSKIENGHLDIVYKNFIPAESLRATLRLFEPTLANRDLRLHVEVGETPLCQGDPVRLGQVLVNLLGNAMKFTPRGGSIRVNASMSERDEGYWLTLSVADTGIGIPRDKQADIFEPFVQVAPSGPEPLRGTGLGLAISAQLVKKMGGELMVESRPGAGSTFSFTVPLKPACCDEPGCAACEDQALSFAGKGLTVLVAEDTPDSLKLLTLMLRELGLSVVSAQDGAEAFTRYRERPCDLLILDGQMPGLDGREATLKVREYEHQNGLPSAPIVILSANIDERERVAYLEAGASLSLVKPVSLTSLSRHLARLLPGSEEPIVESPAGATAPIDYLERASAKIGLPVSAIEDIFADFMRELPDYLEAIALALEPLNRSDLSRAAHRLRGAAATLVVDEIKTLAGVLEKRANADDRAALAVVYADLRARADVIERWYALRSIKGAVRGD